LAARATTFPDGKPMAAFFDAVVLLLGAGVERVMTISLSFPIATPVRKI